MNKMWQSDQGDHTYINPVLYADYSDPDVIRVGDTYYMTASSFNCVPGLPILISKDLINWKLVNYAVKYMIDQHMPKASGHQVFVTMTISFGFILACQTKVFL